MPAPNITQEFWEKLNPPSGPRTKIVRFLAETGPASPYDISKSIYESAFSGYASILRNLGELDRLEIVQRIRTEIARNKRKKNIYALTSYTGICASWAYVGPRLNFERMLDVNKDVFQRSGEAVIAFKVIWMRLGPNESSLLAKRTLLSSPVSAHTERDFLYTLVLQLIKNVDWRKFSAIISESLLIASCVGKLQDSVKQIMDQRN